MAKCKSCGAEIRFIRMESGKMMPVDNIILAADCVVPEGIPGTPENVETLIAENGKTYRGVVVKPSAELLDGLLFPCYRPHWATCPNADQHRRK